MKAFLVLIFGLLAFGACKHLAPPEVSAVKSETGEVFRTGFIPPKTAPKNVRSAFMGYAVTLPETFDWRSKVELSPIKSQGNCGSCWAFSTTATFQDVLRILGEKVDFSEQYLVSCNNEGWSCADGGNFAHDMHKSPSGGVLTSDYPYEGIDSACKSGLKYNQQLLNWQYVPNPENPSVDEIKAAIYKYGPVSTTVAVDSKFSSYSGGIFEDTGYRSLNHATNIVGWGKDYWIMRNSWGKGWGENGYMRIKFGANGIGTYSNYIIYKDIPEPAPNPEPGPSPEPTPTPDPTPDCKPRPIADTGYRSDITVRKNSAIRFGTRAQKGTTYFWEGDPSFSVGKVEAVAIVLKATRSIKVTVTATNKCGSASDSTMVRVR
jgi:hypothetical protein